MHFDRFSGVAWEGSSHSEVGAIVHVHDHCDEVGCEAEAVKGAFNAWPGEVVVRFGDVIEDGVACFGVCAGTSGAGFAEACGDRVDGFMNAFSFEESKLGRVKEGVGCNFGA